MTPSPPTRRARLLLLLLFPLALLALFLFGKPRSPQAAPSAPTATPTSAARARAPTLDRRARQRASVEGQVTDPELVPIARATVCGSARSKEHTDIDKREPVCAETDREGRYRLTGLVPARWTVTASAPGRLPVAYRSPGADGEWFLELDVGEARAGVDLILPGGGVELKGHVKDISGGGVHGAQIMVHSFADHREDETGAFARSDADGAFSVWVHPGNVSAYAFAEGYTEGSADGTAPGVELEILLTPESVLVGRVVDAASHEPVSGARVSAEARWRADYADALSDAEGRFKIRRLEPGRYKPSATTKGRFGEAKESVLLGLGQTSSEVIIEVHPASSVAGRVVNADTLLPCTEGDVLLRDVARQERHVADLEKDGAARFLALLPGTYEVRVDCTDKVSEEHYPPLTISEAAEPEEEPVWTVHDGARIRGRAVDHEDKPVHAQISARMKVSDPRGPRAWGNGATRADGTFTVEGLVPGTYVVEADAYGLPSPEPATVELIAGQTPEVKFVFDRGGDIAGTVVDEDRQPVAGVEVEPHGPKYHWGSETHSSADGSFTIKGLAPGEYRVTARRGSTRLRAPGEGENDRPGVLVTVSAGKVAHVKLVIERHAGEIQGRVLDETGAPATDAFIDAERESEDPDEAEGSARRSIHSSWNQSPVLTDLEGKFTLRGLARGRYTLRAYRHSGGEALMEHVRLGANVALTIRKTAAISGTVTARGAPLDRFTVEIADKEAGVSRSESFFRTGGAWKLDDLPAGKYEIFADAPEGMATGKAVLADGRSAEGIALSLAPYATVHGQVVARDDGAPVPGIRVYVRSTKEGFSFSPAASYEDVITDASGHFEVKRVVVGPIGLFLMPTDRDESAFSFTSTAAEATEGDTDIGQQRISRKGAKEPDGDTDGGGEGESEDE